MAMHEQRLSIAEEVAGKRHGTLDVVRMVASTIN